MSSASTVTASVACNCIPGNEVELPSCMCILVLIRNDGTPFNATSIQEEDIVELCIQSGQTHPKGVLWYTVVGLVVLFHSVDEMLVMVCGVIKVMVLCEEPIRLDMTPPSTTHVIAYMMVRGGEPSSTHPPIPDREEEPQPSPSDPPTGWEDPTSITGAPWHLLDTQLWQLMEDLHWEVALWELNALPRDPLPSP